ncbi:MAG: oxidoreductase [Candidatus Omnitrophica bacterium CG11_big_fil_rev_8_21_14_0_20_63_9]|nr:MAG: oxidoreductase [Candidatus Omnitrophica bacterium CG11_big_fil_rev_8_21_14_0_20_63_9]
MTLTWLLLVPFIGMLAVLALPRSSVKAIRMVALGATGIVLIMSLRLLDAFDPSLGLQFEEQVSWIPQLAIFYRVGVDGLSLPMVLLTTLLSFLACIGSFSITDRHKEYFALYLLLEIGMLGTFLAIDLFLFYIFWEIVLVPMYFLIGMWGGGRREYSAFKFFVYTLAGSLFMLLAILALYLHPQGRTFDMFELAAKGHTFPVAFQQLLFIGFFLGFAIKVPIFPFHTWLPDAHVDAPTPGSVLLAGVLLKMGAYGFFRISYPILPEAAQWFSWTMGLLGAINIVYGAFVAMAQTDFKRLVAYSSVSHMGFVLLGLASLTSEGMNGAMLQMFSHGLLTGGMFLLVGVLYDRAHTRELAAFGGLGAKLPKYAALLIFFSLGSLGLPGLSGFVAEFLSLLGAFRIEHLQVLTMISVIGIVIAAAYMLKVIQQILLGPLNQKWQALSDMNARELISLVPLLLLVLLVGLYPRCLLDLQSPTIQQLLAHILFGK